MTAPASPVTFPEWAGRPIVEEIDGRPVITGFDPPDFDVETGVTDLSHRPKAVVNGHVAVTEMNLKIGEAKWNTDAYFAVQAPDEGWIFDLSGPGIPSWKKPAFTDMTHAMVLFAVWGIGAKDLLQRLV
ncbi:MAG: hypothetical protein AB1659_06940, partial [Thermodesulfobacteriota bacterium]